MSDSVLQRLATSGRNFTAELSAGASSDSDPADDLGAFGWLRGVRDRAIMLELRKKTGNVVAIGYSWLEKVDFDASGGITLHMQGQIIRIKGRNLNGESRPHVRLFQGIIRHKVPWIQETDQAGILRADKNATVVESIEC
jgi:hypothetical protein